MLVALGTSKAAPWVPPGCCTAKLMQPACGFLPLSQFWLLKPPRTSRTLVLFECSLRTQSLSFNKYLHANYILGTNLDLKEECFLKVTFHVNSKFSFVSLNSAHSCLLPIPEHVHILHPFVKEEVGVARPTHGHLRLSTTLEVRSYYRAQEGFRKFWTLFSTNAGQNYPAFWDSHFTY